MVMQDTKFAWADDEPLTRREERERERQRDDRETINQTPPTAETLRELEPPRAFTKIDEPEPAGYTAVPEPAAAATPSQPAASATSAAESLYTPDPVASPAEADAGHVVNMTPSFGSLFDASNPAAASLLGQTESSLDNLFGTKTERRQARRTTPLLTAETLGAATSAKSDVRTSTGPAWIIAMVPLFQLVLSLLFLTALGMGDNLPIFLGIMFLPYFLVIGLAFADYRALKANGMHRPAHWAFAAGTAPLYLVLRARASIRETGHGVGPLLTWLGLGLLHIASAIAIPGLIIALLPTMFATQIEDSVKKDAFLISGSEWSVECPATPPLIIGQSIECAGIANNGTNYDITVSLERSNGWVAWQVTDWGIWNVSK